METIEWQLLELYRDNGKMPFFDRFFARARLKVLPLAKLNRVVPQEGTIVEIGCGHGLICNYLALASHKRKVVGIDIDPHRIAIAPSTVENRNNIEFFLGEFQDYPSSNVDMVILFGVLLLIPFSEWKGLFGQIRAALKAGGEVLLHDVLDDGSLTFRLHRAKEGLLKKTGITKGEGFFVKKPDELKSFVEENGFTIQDLGRGLDVPLHSCFTWILKKS